MIKRFSASGAIEFQFDNGKRVRVFFNDNSVVITEGPSAVPNIRGARMNADQFADYLAMVSKPMSEHNSNIDDPIDW